MVDEYSNNPMDESKEIFLNLNEQVTNISNNKMILMEYLKINFERFMKFGSANMEASSNGEYRDKKDPKQNQKGVLKKRYHFP